MQDKQIKKEIQTLKKIVREMVKGEGIPRSEVKVVLDAIESGDYESLNQEDLFLLWDSLGCHGDLSLYGEHVYCATGVAWQCMVQGTNRSEEIYAEMKKNLAELE